MNKIVEKIMAAKKIAIFSHIKTDCDAVCSSLATKLALQSLGKVADVFIDSVLSNQMQGLVDAETINKGTPKDYDLYLCLDNATLDRLGKYKYAIIKNKPKTCQIDHHATNECYCKINYIDGKASSTCEILPQFFDMLGIKITSAMAKLLLTGIYTDTGRLCYSCTTCKTFAVVSRLAGCYNGTIDTITYPVFYAKTQGEYQLNKQAYANFEFISGGKIGVLAITGQDFLNTGTTMADTHSLPDIGLSVASTKVVILISEDTTQDNCYYVSIRTKGDISARAIAQTFGGGGHPNASGCKIFDTLENVKTGLIKAAQEAIEDARLL